MKYGYTRPIVHDEQGVTQLKKLNLENTFIEAHGLAKNRTALEDVLMTIKKGDELFVQNIIVLADSLQHFLDILRLATCDEITIHFIDEQITNHTIQKLSILQSATFFVNLQSAFLSHSSTFSLRDAKRRGKSIGRPRKSDNNLQKAFAMYDSKKYTLFDIKEETGISKSTLYRYLDERATSLRDEE